MTDQAVATVSPVTNQVVGLMDAADRLGQWMAAAYHFKNLEQGKVAAMTCLTEGLKPAEFMQTYHVLENGALQMTANAMLAKFRIVGGKYKIVQNDETVCEIEFDWLGQKVKQSFTIEQAKKKGLVKANSAWATWPEDQLMWTVVRKFLRRYVPEHFAGAFHADGTPEEALIEYGKPKALVQPAGSVPTLALTDEPETIEPEVLPPEESPQESSQPKLTDVLKQHKIRFGEAAAFLRDKQGWVTAESMQGTPIGKVLDGLSEHKQTLIINGITRFKEGVAKYVSEQSGEAGADDGGDGGSEG